MTAVNTSFLRPVREVTCIPIGAARGKQQPQRYVPKAACEVAQHLVGGLAAAAILLVPHAALANARLPPVDSGKT